jgi:uncharacterized protein
VNREEVSVLLTQHLAELRALGVRSLELFGSTARGEARPESDVDLLVEFDRPSGYFALFRLQDRLEQILGRKVDLGTKASLRESLRERVLLEAMRVA